MLKPYPAGSQLFFYLYKKQKKAGNLKGFPYFLLFFFLLLKVCSGFRQKKTKSYHLKRNIPYFFFFYPVFDSFLKKNKKDEDAGANFFFNIS